MSSVGMNIKLLRVKSNMLQKDVAKLLNVSQQTYSGYEKGKYEPSFDVLCKLANYFNVSVDYILGRTTA